jgi:DNA-binding Lrp family transcriptional regulator
MAENTLLQLVDQFDEAIRRGESISSLRNKLASLREQAEALHARLAEVQARLEELETRLESDNPAIATNDFEEEAEEILKTFFENYGENLLLLVVAEHLGLSKETAGYHLDNLTKAGMIEVVASTPDGPAYALTVNGKAHVARRMAV